VSDKYRTFLQLLNSELLFPVELSIGQTWRQTWEMKVKSRAN